MTRVERVLGVTEEELVRQSAEERQLYICKQIGETGEEILWFRNIQTGVLTPIGPFCTPTVEELRAQVKQTMMDQPEEENKDRQFYCLYHVDIGELQTRLKTTDRCLIQIAGNFNCLNVPNRRRKPDEGRLVELAFQQKTQGPAATFGPLACNLFRTHFSMPTPQYSGQTLKHQISLLDNVKEYTGIPINGKLTLRGDEIPIPDTMDLDAIVGKVRVGLQTDCHVMYGRNKRQREVYLLDTAKHCDDFSKLPIVDQCHVAAVNWNSLTEDHTRNHVPAWTQTPAKQKEIYNLSRALLRAGYEGVYLAALMRRTKHLYLTLVGGGVFGNPNQLIVQELAHAHKKWASHPASCLEAVYLCGYSQKDNVECLLKKEGIKIAKTRRVGQ
ncbi:expressed unknown protein [Seminavis robusta]|uniref:Uncharacterized protein n=1 Tax=Seminavis robusta TaxID=568900 RepID=A0A9N8DH38_9STRA|nr:expressed unknown protein [Seminavis robusta]|eukprot:Sro83_g044430.1 n/a (385) ;mRNA; f:82939-84093